MNQVKTFSHPLFGQVRTMVMTDGQIGFVGKDVAVALGYQNPSNAINIHVDNEDKTTYLIQVSGSNYKTKTTFINESGLYALVLSKSPAAGPRVQALGHRRGPAADSPDGRLHPRRQG